MAPWTTPSSEGVFYAGLPRPNRGDPRASKRHHGGACLSARPQGQASTVSHINGLQACGRDLARTHGREPSRRCEVYLRKIMGVGGVMPSACLAETGPEAANNTPAGDRVLKLAAMVRSPAWAGGRHKKCPPSWAGICGRHRPCRQLLAISRPSGRGWLRWRSCPSGRRRRC